MKFWKKYAVRTIVLLMAMGTALGIQAQTLKFMTYNLHHCAGMDKQLSEKRIAEVIAAERPDIVAVQELDSMTNRCPSYQLGEIAARLKMQPVYAPSITFGGGKYGIGILSKQKPISVRSIPLPGKEPRVLLICEYEDYCVANTHLALQESNRLQSLDIIVREAKRWDKPFLIAGDWNATPDSKFIRELSRYFWLLNNTDAFTYPAEQPDRCIDYIALYKGKKNVRVKKSYVVPEAIASDHRPVVVKIKLFNKKP